MLKTPKVEFIVTSVDATHHIWMQILQEYPDGGIRVSIPKWDSPHSEKLASIVRDELETGMYVEAELASQQEESPNWYIETLYRYGKLEAYLEMEPVSLS